MALAQILNAEGEKLNRIIESTDDLEKIFLADRAVRVVDEVIVKDQALLRELERILEICSACEMEEKGAHAAGGPGRSTFPGSKS